ncbi:MAG: DSD1 family PLP-dependent enzyme, partial [Candidatus Latescibacteria bacterium]|nr:DSD1 family PLP-dependent enzyme [Candidatus Latescibacterota bacterium]
MPYTPIGQSKWDLDTPALIVDLDKMENNIRQMAARCRESGLNWRPHAKGHKTPAIAHSELQAGAIGITCAKLGEAEVLADAGISDILIANQVVGTQKIARLVNLRRRADIIVAVDDPIHIQTISEAARAANVDVRILIEVDVGMERCGTPPGAPTLALAQQAQQAPGVVFAGIMGYEGHAMALDDPEKEAACRKAVAQLSETRALIEKEGIKVDIVSAGGTGTLAFTPDFPGITEIQAGGGIFMDTYYRNGLHVHGLEQALTILTTIISRTAPDRAVADAGRKTTSNQFSLPEVKDRTDVVVTGLSAEHAALGLADSNLKIGDKIELISGYSDMTVFLHDQLYGIRNDRV